MMSLPTTTEETQQEADCGIFAEIHSFDFWELLWV